MAVLLLAAACAAGCAVTRTGSGPKASAAEPVTFYWKSSGKVSGSMTATLADGETYTGNYFRIAGATQVSSFGRIAASLSTSDGGHMRCRFRLLHPDEGMAAGGRGECEMPDGQQIEARLPIAWGLDLARAVHGAATSERAP